MNGIQSRSERRAMERAKEKHLQNLMRSGYGEWKDITDEPHTQTIVSNQKFRGAPTPYKILANGMFLVQCFDEPNAWNAIRVMVRMADASPLHDWSLLQRIKNDLFGVDRVGLEVYPAEKNKQDVANMYWLWILPAGFDCPIEVKRK